eukprot:gnl/Dysnectes_brevis/6576_a10318_218.p1 GENE.gnl/Dysnectes_brevis/6576_a10318_218~~gnl/Dysnectes_brevis/6576_a10318_218.p1  ORF type:complete len:329 (-),score=108.11 gnl/Dysnectes_brevis/6576_a10318_218:40-1026(-)
MQAAATALARELSLQRQRQRAAGLLASRQHSRAKQAGLERCRQLMSEIVSAEVYLKQHQPDLLPIEDLHEISALSGQLAALAVMPMHPVELPAANGSALPGETADSLDLEQMMPASLSSPRKASASPMAGPLPGMDQPRPAPRHQDTHLQSPRELLRIAGIQVTAVSETPPTPFRSQARVAASPQPARLDQLARALLQPALWLQRVRSTRHQARTNGGAILKGAAARYVNLSVDVSRLEFRTIKGARSNFLRLTDITSVTVPHHDSILSVGGEVCALLKINLSRAEGVTLMCQDRAQQRVWLRGLRAVLQYVRGNKLEALRGMLNLSV